ncbi:hypothetical protein ACN6LA_005166 [Streptomyces sp. SAS_269]|uniref:hypothetical protein n=1 Tax=Streptomyces sp. SAS_269 TaxID=3412749 RepID=UPI00403C8D97
MGTPDATGARTACAAAVARPDWLADEVVRPYGAGRATAERFVPLVKAGGAYGR